ncbi:MAG: hypothetical protein ACXAD7_11550 [Candidatus Kariarchaeaceae archaeon]|jgi:hypothetical protein
MGNETKEIHAYCSQCNMSIFFPIDVTILNESARSTSGIYRTSLIHTDHILICDIDTNGAVRGFEVVDICPNPAKMLIDHIATTFYSLNREEGRQIKIDFYTANDQLRKFLQTIISSMLDLANMDDTDKNRIIISSYMTSTMISADRIHISIGPQIQDGTELLEDPQKGIVIDIEEAEKRKLNLEDTIINYDWIAFLVPKNSQDQYHHAISSICTELSKPFFIGSLNTQSLEELFNYIFAVAGL